MFKILIWSLLKGWFAETRYVYHAIWGYLNSTIHKSLPSVVPTLQPLKLYCFSDFIIHA
jgi:hypothetical protein